ncbi:MAG TPA: low specificity L-threonine aldolase [Microthrixaceae bacterium]|nr:low specificity L-threonine aldolase [Microthrixaceae bacterium]
MGELPLAPAGSFASDNFSGVHPAVMGALAAANSGHAGAYGADPWTARAKARFAELLGSVPEIAFTWGGTGANIVGLQCLLNSWQAVICADSAHIAVDECGAPERFIGSKLIEVPTDDGKLNPELIRAQMHGIGDEHHVQPRVVSLTQSTEMGTLYSIDELGAIVDTAREHNLLVHVDGARISNAAAALGCSLADLISGTGVDVLTFGGTKNGLMYGEAVLFMTPGLGDNVRFVRKQAAQLPSKMRFVAAQFEALLSDDLWLANARHANSMTMDLASRVEAISGVEVLRKPEVNSLFVRLPSAVIQPMSDWSQFWVWDEADSVVRWMCSFDTTAEDVELFAAGVEFFLERLRLNDYV